MDKGGRPRMDHTGTILFAAGAWTGMGAVGAGGVVKMG